MGFGRAGRDLNTRFHCVSPGEPVRCEIGSDCLRCAFWSLPQPRVFPPYTVDLFLFFRPQLNYHLLLWEVAPPTIYPSFSLAPSSLPPS